MAIKYVEIPERRQIIAILNNTKYAAVNQIRKSISQYDWLYVDASEYLMNSSYRAVATCSPEDEYDPEVGKKIAKEKVLKKYYSAVDTRYAKFTVAMMRATADMMDRVKPASSQTE